MKVRDSGMPEEGTWEGFFDARQILKSLEFRDTGADVVDFGCGYGTFSIAAARLTSGTVHALDIESEMTSRTAARAAELHRDNVRTVQRDFFAEGTGLPDASAGYAMLFNILHTEDPLVLLREAHRILKPGGRVAVIHWIHDASTPRGPDLSIRPRPEQCAAWLVEAGFEQPGRTVPLPPFHYGLVARKARAHS